MLIALIVSITAVSLTCDRVNLYDIASSKSRTAYAVIYNGTISRLAIVSINWDKTYTTQFQFLSLVNGISVNSQTITIYDSTYIYRAENDLTTWLSIAQSPPALLNTIGYHDSFVYLNSNTLFMLNMSTQTWDTIATLTNGQDIFQGHDGEIYAFVPDTPSFYRFTGINFEPTTQFNSPPTFLGNFIGGYRTPRYFYVFYSGTSNSIFRTDGITDTNFNSSTSWDSIFDVTVTDDDKIYAMISESGSNSLIHLTAANTYTTLLNCGSDGLFKLDSLDNEHLIVAVNANISGYNGLFIYNVKDKKIEKFITTEDTIALYVPR